MNKETPIKQPFNWCWLTVSEVYSIFIIAGRMAGMQADMMLEKKLRVLHLYPKAARKRLSSRDLIEGSLQH